MNHLVVKVGLTPKAALNVWKDQGKMKPACQCPVLQFLLPEAESLALNNLQLFAGSR
jgi:hypothetical protein